MEEKANLAETDARDRTASRPHPRAPRADRPGPRRPAARGPAAAPAEPAVHGPGAPLGPGSLPIGRLALRPGQAPPLVLRRGGHRRLVRRPAPVDSDPAG